MDHRQRLYDAYSSSHYARLGEKSARDLRNDQEDLEAFFGACLPARPEADILEVGCGTGVLLRFLTGKGYRSVIGIDRSPEQVELARRAGAGQVEAADAVPYLSERPAGFDLIFALDLLEHLRKEEVLPFLDAAFQALRPGGALALRTVNAAGLLAGRIVYGDFTHECAFTQASLGQVLRVAGFEGLSFRSAYPPSLARGPRGWLRYALWKAFEQAIKLYMHATTGSGILHSGHVWSEEMIAIARKPGPAEA